MKLTPTLKLFQISRERKVPLLISFRFVNQMKEYLLRNGDDTYDTWPLDDVIYILKQLSKQM